MQVTYRIPLDSPMGYLELLPSPWNPDNMVLAVLGNGSQGIGWAATSLITSNLRSQLAGNFAVVNDRQIISSDTRLTSTIQSNVGPTPAAVAAVPPSATQSLPASQRPNWILPILILSILAAAVVLVITLLRSRARNRTPRPRKEN